MANLLQIKRSATSGIPGSLANGELAFTSNGDILYIGSPNGSVIPIGGFRVPGTLTANQALVANSTSGINNIITANLTISGFLTANGSLGTSGQVLSSNSTGGVYWAPAGAAVNTSAQYVWSNLHTFQANLHTGNSTVNTQVSNAVIVINDSNTFTINSSSVSFGNATSNAVANLTGFYVNGSAIYANATNLTTGTLDAARLPSTIVNTSANFTIGGSSTFSGNNNFTGAQTYFSSNVVIGATNTNIGGYLAAGNGYFGGAVTIAGNLTVQGTTTQIDTTTILVKDNLIQLADAQANTGTFLDAVDAGLFIATGNTSANYYSGFARIAASSTNANPYFKLFSTQTPPNNTILDTTANTGTLQAYLAPYGTSGAFIANSTVVNITANSTLSSTITANTLTLTTALAGTSGGTGKSTMTNQAILVGNATNGYDELTLGANTYFLQSNGTALVYSANLDGGSF